VLSPKRICLLVGIFRLNDEVIRVIPARLDKWSPDTPLPAVKSYRTTDPGPRASDLFNIQVQCREASLTVFHSAREIQALQICANSCKIDIYNVIHYICREIIGDHFFEAPQLIKSFFDRRTEDVFNRITSGEAGAICPKEIWPVARRKLDQLNAVVSLDSLRIPPGNKLEALKGDRRGQCSIRINDQFRVCFIWTPEGPERVEITDYH